MFDDLFGISGSNPRVPYTLAKLAICYCTLASLWLLVSGLSSQFLTLFPNQLAFEISTGLVKFLGNGHKIV